MSVSKIYIKKSFFEAKEDVFNHNFAINLIKNKQEEIKNIVFLLIS